MKTYQLDIVRYIVEGNFYKSDNQLILQENNNVNFEKKESKRFKQYF